MPLLQLIPQLHAIALFSTVKLKDRNEVGVTFRPQAPHAHVWYKMLLLGLGTTCCPSTPMPRVQHSPDDQ